MVARRFLLPLLLFLAAFILIVAYFVLKAQSTGENSVRPTQVAALPTSAPPGAVSTLSPTPFVTTTPVAVALPSPSPTGPATRPAALTPSPSPTPAPAPSLYPTLALDTLDALPLDYLSRFGVTASLADLADASEKGLAFGSAARWYVVVDVPQTPPITFWQLINVAEEGSRTPWPLLDEALAANPGSMWIIGNEPDVVVQDNVTPWRYAEIYHELYTYIKEKDPTAKVVVGAVSQPTPLRLAYLDIVLETYQENYGQPMPVDIWNVHAFTLREERDGWGIGIPPGMDDTLATLYEIEDHDSIEIFRQNIIGFREWMAQRGYADRPLIVSEYGFLMPLEYGFTQEEVTEFMLSTFDFFLTARNDTGYPADDYRLVQWWLWFILYEGENPQWSATFLYDRPSKTLTTLGEAYADYVATHSLEP